MYPIEYLLKNHKRNRYHSKLINITLNLIHITLKRNNYAKVQLELNHTVNSNTEQEQLENKL